MITHIRMENIATYSEPVDVNFKALNFIYGGNGTGKTTISKLISGELQHPSCVIDFDDQPCLPLLTEINSILLDFNAIISKNNRLIERQKETQEYCQQEVWRLIVNDFSDTIKVYLKKRTGQNQAISNCEKQREDFSLKAQEIREEIKEKRASISNIQYTIRAINRILERYGFTGYMLEENTAVPGTYKIIRPDGRDAKESLSEGEYNFITFLYD